ncbi:MAG: SPFH domain-containing protein [Patescibacteria group bacterium]
MKTKARNIMWLPPKELVLGTGLGIAALWYLTQYCLVFTPKKQVMLVMNRLRSDEKGEALIRVVKSGLHFKFPWEETSASDDGLFSLQKIRTNFDVQCPSKDGPIIKVTGGFTYAPDPDNLIGYYVSRNVAGKKVLDSVQGYLSGKISEKEAVSIRNAMGELSESATNYFSKEHRSTEEEKKGCDVVTKIEQACGIIFEELTIADVVFEDKFQGARTTKAVMETLEKTAAQLKETGINGQSALDATLVVHGSVERKVVENVIRAEGQGINGFVETLQGIFSGRGRSD